MISYVGFELMPSALVPCLALLSMAGMGALALRVFLGREHDLPRLDFVVVALGLGMAMQSLLLFFAGAWGGFDYRLVLGLRIGGLLALAFALYAYKPWRISEPGTASAWLPLTFVGLLCVLMTLGAYLSPMIHADARQYHLGFPWLTSVTGHLVTNDTLLHNGTYLGYDILYLSVADLRQLMDAPAMMDRLKLFNAMTMAIFPFSALLLCRAFGASRAAAALAALAVFTVGPIAYWGYLKNDVFAAAIALVALAVLVRAYRRGDQRLLCVATTLAGYAVSVKITNAIVLAIPFAFVYFSGKFARKTRIAGIVLGLALVLPWAVHAYVVSGNPVAPVAVQVPAEVRLAGDARNANGIEPSALNMATKFVPVVLRIHPISGNETIGILALASLAACLVLLLRAAIVRKWGLPETIAASALIWFFVFYVTRYDNRFLSRYLLICFGAVFAFVCFKTETHLRGLSTKGKGMVLVAAVGLVLLFVVKNPTVGATYKYFDGFQGAEQTNRAKEAMISQYAAPYQALALLRKPGEAVAINDHMVLFLEPPFYNLHAMHAANLNLYLKDEAYVRRYLSERSVGYLLFRRGISGGTPAVDRYMADCAQQVRAFGNALTLYAVKQDCR